jgi:PAS domain S-box-containing protein
MWFRALEEDDRFRDLLEHMGAIITEYDTDGRVVYVSSSVTGTLGYDPDELVGVLNRDLVHPADLEATRRLRAGASARPFRQTAAQRSRHKAGHWVWLETSATRAFTAPDGTTHGLAFSRDITALKQAEDELRESETRYRRVVEATDDVVVESNPAGDIVFHTPNLGATLGYTAEEMTSFDPRATIHPDDVRGTQQAFAEALATSRPSRLSYRALHRDGSCRWLVSTGVPYEHDSGEVRFLNITRDVTDRVEAARRRVEQEARSQQAQRLESLGVMAGGMAHDFNNLLTPILTDASLALGDLPPDSPLRARLERIQRTARRAAELTHHMLAYAGAERLDTRTVDLTQLVESSRELLEGVVVGPHTLRLELAEGPPDVLADPGQLERVLLNLVTNAVEALSDEGGVVVVRSGTVELDGSGAAPAVGDALEPGDHPFLEVEDDGAGMDADTQRRIFDPFFTTRFTGRGLGLASVSGILKAHHGAIEIESTPGMGTRMRVLLPRAPADRSDEVASDATTSRNAAPPPARVLVIDDDEGIRDVTTECLERAGFDVLSAPDGERGIERFRAHADAVSLVLLDRTMPGLSSDATRRALLAIRPDVRILLMSGYASEPASGTATEEAVVGFLGKPFLPEELIDRVRAALDAPA